MQRAYDEVRYEDMTTGQNAISRTRISGLTKPSGRDWLLAVVVLVVALLYFPLNQAPAHPHVLTTSLDSKLPVVPVFAVPYIGFLPVFWLTVLWAFATGRSFAQLALAIALVYGISDVVYALYPTYMPRPGHVHGFLSGLVRYVYANDHPYNDFPSGHTASAALLAFYAWPRKVLIRGVALVLSLAVMAATLLIKQHSIAGALSGVLLALLVWFALPGTRRLLVRP